MTTGFDKDKLRRLLVARENRNLAQEAQNIANEQQQEIKPEAQTLIDEAKKASPDGPLGNPGIWSIFGKGLEKIDYVDETSAGFFFGLGNKEQRERAKAIRKEDSRTGVKEYWSATRQAYIERDLPLWKTLPVEMLLSPFNLIPFGVYAKAVTVPLKAAKAVSKVMPKVAQKLIPAIQFEEMAKVTRAALDVRKFNNIQNFGPLSYVFGKIRGAAMTMNPNNALYRALLEHLDISAKSSSAATANAFKVSEVKDWARFFDIEDRASKAYGLIKGTGTAMDGKPIGSALEGFFNVDKTVRGGIKGEVDWDKIARWVGRKDKKVANKNWLQLISSDDGIRAIKKHLIKDDFIEKGLGEIKDIDIGSLGRLFYGYADLAKQAKRLKLPFATLDGTPYLARRVLSRQFNNVIENTRKVKPGKEVKAAQKRTFTTELEQEMFNAITTKTGADAAIPKLEYLNDLTKTYELYSREIYQAMNNELLRTNLDKLTLMKGSGVVWKLPSKHNLELGKILKGNLKHKYTYVVDGKSRTVTKSQRLKELGFNNLADELDKGASLKDLMGRKLALEKAFEEGTQNSTIDPVRWLLSGNKLPPRFNQFFFTGRTQKEANAIAKKFQKLTGLEEDRTFIGLGARGVARVADVLRVGKTGFDFGFSLLQGLPTLARAMYDPKQMKVWIASVKEGTKAFCSPKSMDIFMREMRDTIVTAADGRQLSLLDEYVETGGELGEFATDIYKGSSAYGETVRLLTGGKIEGVVGAPGRAITKGVGWALGKFERQFQFSADVLRLKGYEIMRNSVVKGVKSPEEHLNALRSLNQFLGKSTGALNPVAAGISPTQQSIERGFIFFSSRYTRASVGLIADAMTAVTDLIRLRRPGIEATKAAQTLASIGGFGLHTYVVMSHALNQDVHLDPSDSRFMTVEINGNRVGFGSFWMSTARASLKVGMYASNIGKEKDILDELQDNPIFRYAKSRTSPVTSVARDLLTGTDFLGRELDTKLKMGKHVLYATLPFAVEGAILEEGYKTAWEKGIGFATEMLGMRVRPSNIFERRNQMRDSLATRKHEKDWGGLTVIEQKELEKESSELTAINQDVIKAARGGGGELAGKLQRYYEEKETIQKNFDEKLREGVQEMQEEWFFPRELRKLTLQTANQVKRIATDILNKKLEEGKDLFDVQRYFEANKNRFGDEMRIEDIAADEFITNVIGGDYDTPRGYNWQKREQAYADFKQKWGTEYLVYAEKRLKIGQNLPDIVDDYYNARETFKWFFEASEEAVFQSRPNPERARQLRIEWLNATDSERIVLEEDREMRTIKSKISATKKAIRKQDQGVDAFLYRWGYTTTLLHANNEGEENFFNQTTPLALERYTEGPLDFIRGPMVP